MVSTVTRRPVPALVSLLALLLLTGLVWWRVLHRGGAGAESTTCPTPKPTTSSSSSTALPPPARVTVQVLNSTNRSGLASKARTALIALGFQSPKAAGNDSQAHVRGVAEIRYGPSGADAAKLLSFYLPGAKLVPNRSTSSTVVVSLGAKYERVASASAAAAAMAKQHLAVHTVIPTPSSSRRSC